MPTSTYQTPYSPQFRLARLQLKRLSETGAPVSSHTPQQPAERAKQKPISTKRIEKLANTLEAKVQNNEVHQSSVDLVINLMSNLIAKPNGRRFSSPVLNLASQLKTLAHQKALLALTNHNLVMPSKVTVNKSSNLVGCFGTYGLSPELILKARKYFDKQATAIEDLSFGLAFDGIYVAVNDSVHTATQSRHGFTSVEVTNTNIGKQYTFCPAFTQCNSAKELLAPLINKTAYANQILMFVLFPLGTVQPLPIFPVGFIPLCSYNETLLREWLTSAQQQLSANGFRVIFHAGDNSSSHRTHFARELNSHQAAFPLREMRKGVANSSPIPLQDFPHLLRKLISPLVKASRCTMVGNLPILQTLFIRAQSVFAFPVSYLLQFDEQNDKRVQFFCSDEFNTWLGAQVDGKGAQLYLQHVRLLREAFMNTSISWASRLYKVWQVFSFFVYWRRWNEDKFVKAADQKFISIPTYTALTQLCISFVLLVKNNYEHLHQIVPWNLSEKPCESFFSRVRSFLPNLSNVSVTECFDIVNKEAQNLISSPRVPLISDSPILIGFELKDIALLLLKADLEVRALLEKTALEDTISTYACATFAYQNETEYNTVLYDAPGRITAQEYPVPQDEVLKKVSRNPFVTRAKNKGFIEVPEVLIDKFQQLGINIFNGKASKESIINVVSHRRSTHSYSSKNRLDRPSNKITLPDLSDVVTEICTLLEMDVPNLVEDDSSSSSEPISSNEEEIITTNDWYWATKGDAKSETLQLVYVAQINQQKTFKRNDKDKTWHEILTEVPRAGSKAYQSKALVIPAYTDANRIICSTEIVRWENLDLDSIVAKVTRTPETIQPWEWTKKIHEEYSFDELANLDLQRFLVDPLV